MTQYNQLISPQSLSTNKYRPTLQVSLPEQSRNLEYATVFKRHVSQRLWQIDGDWAADPVVPLNPSLLFLQPAPARPTTRRAKFRPSERGSSASSVSTHEPTRASPYRRRAHTAHASTLLNSAHTSPTPQHWKSVSPFDLQAACLLPAAPS
jgi:hypothetical protein